ncbi:MAG: bifunctional diaminohydroxyphosphoribosylaminopyrimidine deaminase/5-amino-6-(5-phosphoribosylamino)uracil reductase RibD [Candidatus Omnitrophica bacterium]|nr:bifunctional diaminohydroxyphosphoribosylaminopyrimidine deaminase/5-amino-6-(5-phosphoribosylamino)uracil reductase RibD [Candidatus Omnitrophota bacterium]
MKKYKDIHEKFMSQALKLALKARGRTLPNPMVGALVVKNGRVIARGFHEKAGSPHAEVIALDKAGKSSRGAQLYVTLEPCVHFGRTPPCVNRIIASGIKEVFIGMIDPNPLNNGKGVSILRQNKIKVRVGFLEKDLRKANEVFIKYISQRIPFVTVKVAESLDGRIATRTGDSKWITSDKSRSFAHRMRGDFDAVMVGVNTVLRDNPRLDAWYSRRHPIKVIVDTQLSTPEDASLFGGNPNVILVTLPTRPGQETENRKVLAAKARILEVKEKSGQINLRDMLKRLAQLEIANILVEGGGTLIGSFFDEGLVDKAMFFISPKIIGGKEAIGSVMGRGITRIDSAIRLKDIKLRRLGEDLLIEGYPK